MSSGERVFLNGKVVPYEQAHIHVEDRGNVFADGVYEVVRFYNGKPFEMQAHLERLARSAELVRIRLPMPLWQFSEAAQGLMAENGVTNGLVYMQVSRGVAPRTHAFPVPAPPATVFMTARPFQSHPPELIAQGVPVRLIDDVRWRMCHVKSLMLLANVLGKEEARAAGAFEGVFVRDGYVTEGTSTNIFIVSGKRLVTHPEGPFILPGISRRVVLRLAAEAGLPVEERPFTPDELLAADEAFLTGTTAEVLPVTRVDDRPVGTGRPGPVTLQLRSAFQALTA